MLRLHAPPAASPESVEDETHLVERAQHDRRDFAPLYRRYATPVYRYCYNALGSREAAEDATSQVFEKVLARLPSYRPRGSAGSFRSWVFAIAHNVIVDAVRATRPVGPIEEAATIEDRSIGPEAHAVAVDASHRLRMALTQLTPDQRRVVELRLAGLCDREIAEVLGRNYETVRTLQRRALIHLQSILGITAHQTQEARDANR